MKAAAAAEKIVTESRPGKSSWSTLALYDLFAQNYRAADASFAKAISYMHTQYERATVLKEVRRSGKRGEAVRQEAEGPMRLLRGVSSSIPR